VKPQRRPAQNPVSPAKARSIGVAKRPRGRSPAAAHGPDIAAALRQVMALCGKPHAAGRTKRLDALFRDLLKEAPPRDAEETGDLIWALWTNHDDAAATDAMQKAIGLIVAKETAPARAALDALCDRYPDWAEAWNKRATLAFIELRDADAVADIIETLAREPRHFGALAGFGQIALRNGHPAAALAAYETALALNPHLEELAGAADDLRGLYASRPN
jgi:tetratricopeptide (TPR) repeat protein